MLLLLNPKQRSGKRQKTFQALLGQRLQLLQWMNGQPSEPELQYFSICPIFWSFWPRYVSHVESNQIDDI